MKKNTQKLLLSLYSESSQQSNQATSRVKLANLKMLVPELTDGGMRSLLHFLKANGLIVSERVLGVVFVSITQHGSMSIEAKFPALSSKWDNWQGSWDCLVFVKALESDKQFRYLRTLLMTEGAVAISRGVYISPFSFSDKVVRECKQTYHDAVLMFSVGDWKIASLRNLIVEKYGLLDVIESYSGVSKEISRLLELANADNKFVHRHKMDINLVYDRLIEILREDMGFCSHYFNEAPKVRSMLSQLNSMISQY